MKRRFQTIMCDLSLAALGRLWDPASAAEPKSPNAVLVIQGKVLDSAGNPLGDANIMPYLNGKPYLTGAHGAQTRKDYCHRAKRSLHDRRFRLPRKRSKTENGR